MHKLNLYLPKQKKLKILVDKNKAVGVEFIRDQTTYRMMARKEVILSAGGIKSPQILMMSGIGPQAHLQSKGVRRKHFIK